MSSPRVLIGLGDPAEAGALCRAVAEAGWEALEEPGPDAALARLEDGGFDAALGDAARGGLELARRAAELEHGPEVVLLAGFGTVQDALDAMRQGAFDYLSRPVSEEQVVLALGRAINQGRLRGENLRLRRSLGERSGLGHLRSDDPRMRKVVEVVEAVADTKATLLIQGESGTGKTLLAQTVHARSPRAEEPFVVINCGALPADLLESELFGHVRGAFTGAVTDKPGLFEAAHGGTLFLDEVATASPALQVKLLRVIQDRVFERVGDTRTREVDVRLITATNRDLAEEVAAGRFREDLYYRINVVRVELPPLRERPGDIPRLAEVFLERYAREHGRGVRSLSPDAMTMLCAAPWPGNVRQLQNAIERAVLLTRGAVLGPEALEGDLGLPESAPERPAAEAIEFFRDGRPLTLKEALEGPERSILERALALNDGHRLRTAEMLGVNRTTLFNKMRKHGLLTDS